jgi:hypothetical protein
MSLRYRGTDDVLPLEFGAPNLAVVADLLPLGPELVVAQESGEAELRAHPLRAELLVGVGSEAGVAPVAEVVAGVELRVLAVDQLPDPVDVLGGMRNLPAGRLPCGWRRT